MWRKAKKTVNLKSLLYGKKPEHISPHLLERSLEPFESGVTALQDSGGVSAASAVNFVVGDVSSKGSRDFTSSNLFLQKTRTKLGRKKLQINSSHKSPLLKANWQNALSSTKPGCYGWSVPHNRSSELSASYFIHNIAQRYPEAGLRIAEGFAKSSCPLRTENYDALMRAAIRISAPITKLRDDAPAYSLQKDLSGIELNGLSSTSNNAQAVILLSTAVSGDNDIRTGWQLALRLYHHMRTNGRYPSGQSMGLLLRALTKAQKWEQAIGVFYQLLLDGKQISAGIFASALIAAQQSPDWRAPLAVFRIASDAGASRVAVGKPVWQALMRSLAGGAAREREDKTLTEALALYAVALLKFIPNSELTTGTVNACLRTLNIAGKDDEVLTICLALDRARRPQLQDDVIGDASDKGRYAHNLVPNKTTVSEFHVAAIRRYSSLQRRSRSKFSKNMSKSEISDDDVLFSAFRWARELGIPPPPLILQHLMLHLLQEGRDAAVDDLVRMLVAEAAAGPSESTTSLAHVFDALFWALLSHPGPFAQRLLAAHTHRLEPLIPLHTDGFGLMGTASHRWVLSGKVAVITWDALVSFLCPVTKVDASQDVAALDSPEMFFDDTLVVNPFKIRVSRLRWIIKTYDHIIISFCDLCQLSHTGALGIGTTLRTAFEAHLVRSMEELIYCDGLGGRSGGTKNVRHTVNAVSVERDPGAPYMGSSISDQRAVDTQAPSRDGAFAKNVIFVKGGGVELESEKKRRGAFVALSYMDQIFANKRLLPSNWRLSESVVGETPAKNCGRIFDSVRPVGATSRVQRQKGEHEPPSSLSDFLKSSGSHATAAAVMVAELQGFTFVAKDDVREKRGVDLIVREGDVLISSWLNYLEKGMRRPLFVNVKKNFGVVPIGAKFTKKTTTLNLV